MQPVMFHFTKQPAERFSIGIDWQDRLAEAETLSGVEATAQRLDLDGTPAPEVLDGSGIAGAISYVTVKNGTSGVTYKITVRVKTSLDNVYEADLTMRVLEV
jgi:hypothetical protein